MESIYCPYCQKYTSIDILEIGTGTSMGGRTITARSSWYDSKNKNTWTMKKCNSCQEVVLLKNHGEKIYPAPFPKPTDNRIKELIRNDFKEAKLCYSVGAYKATVVLSRRSLQSICIDKGASKNKKLYQQIEELASNGVITEDLKEWATEVRYVGNDGAHPGEEILKEDAESILELTEQLTNVIYIMPQIATELKNKRKSKSQ